MMYKIHRIICLAAFAVIFVGYSYAQQPIQGKPIDRVVALVGDMMIMESDVMGAMAIEKQRNPSIDMADSAYRRATLDAIIDKKLIIAKAVEDSVVVADSQIEQRWSMWLDYFLQQYGSEARIEQMYGMPLSEIQRTRKEQIREEILQSMVINSKFGDMKVTRNEVEDFYKRYQDSLPEIPESIDVYHIVKEVKVKENVKEETEALALRVRDTILSGGDFGAFAKQYSEDVYSKGDGGNLGWFEKSRLFPEFVKAASKLQEGEVSMPVETPLGIHLIQTIEKREGKLNTRHILFKIGKSQKDKAETMDFLKSIKDSIEKEGIDFELMAKRYSEDIDTKGFGGSLGLLPVAEFPGNLQLVLRDMEDGTVSDPLLYQKDSYHIIYKKETVAAHKANLDLDYRVIEYQTLMDKKSKAVKEWYKELRRNLYWEYVK